ncbi:glutathione synthetase-like isoform X1 [Schistocerca cancellata]|uniref:glutathione synthetase-like isoform X1 n=1 Tax=Schistocerca cancellata TaxID=274614 RepID=UPI002118C3F5|nr:glutathione synthetase-like isoform X1 [Schistocerca cancellata]
MAVRRLEPCVQLPLDEKTLKEVVTSARDWALMHGACMRSKTNYNEDILQFAPFALLPSVFPRKEFERAVNIQPILNELMHKVAHDHEFLTSSLKSTIEVDEFTGNMFKIYETVYNEGFAQRLSLGLLRSDVMLESCCCLDEGHGDDIKLAPYCCWKQVEINTIASGFGWLGPASSHIQRYVLRELGHEEKLENLPPNSALAGLCGGMIKAWKIYGNPKAVIMIVVEDVTYNICDQRFHEFYIRENHPDVGVLRRRYSDLKDQAKLTDNKALFVDGHEVAVVYYRTAYEPAQYGGAEGWKTRLLIERSKAIKCPSIHYHLAGTKKVQQALAHPGCLERFITDSAKVEAIREIFTGLYSLDFDEHGDRAVDMAIANPERYVLKPQREGGGNNVYGQKIREVVEKMKSSKERTAWILMERIAPPVQKNYIVRPGQNNLPEPTDVVSELGIFGVVIGDAEKILVNEQVGHMLRTKLSTVDEGGVAAGLGALDSPYLADL